MRTIAWLLLVVAGLGAAALLGCSSAARLAPSRAPQRLPYSSRDAGPGPREHAPFDLMPATPAGKGGGRPTSPRAVEAAQRIRKSPDGKWIAFEADRDGVHGVWVSYENGERARRLSGPRFALLPRWSPDSTRLVFLARDARSPNAWSLWVADPADTSSSARRLASAGQITPTGMTWFPDSRHVCYGNLDWLIVVDTVTDATRAFRLPRESGRIVGAPAVSPDGKRVVFAVEGDGAWMVSLDGGELRHIVTQSEVDAFAWAPGGRQIAFRDARDGQWKVQMLR